MEGTQGSETSQYLQEEKVNNDSLSSGERSGKSPNFESVIGDDRFSQEVVGVHVVESLIHGVIVCS